ncbi:hypothetical protein [Stakelama marina]|uniref:DUF4868 domain-containing protein n=1 Tax=Stakelama marina TaxID=2826939 RepID=A0A8T4IB58_9SPHN|nr:hypothetical protein [Stakelama marina]MBR0551054.1 hypothetical protein [Stakelama marina]
MSQVVARLKRKSVEICKVMSEEGDIIALPNLDDKVKFDPHYKPEEGQWMTIGSFSDLPYAIDSLGAVINTADFPQLDVDNALDAKFLCIIQGKYRLYQRILPSQVMRKRKWLNASGQFNLIEGEKIILLNDVPDAIHDTSSDDLYFRNFVALKTFFSKIEELYREATEEEVGKFLKNEVMKTDPDFTSEKVSKPNRQRIALAQEKLGAYTKQNVEQLIQEFPDYVKDVEIKDGSFLIKNDNDLKMAIFCIEERFYTTPISKEKRIANSILKIE